MNKLCSICVNHNALIFRDAEEKTIFILKAKDIDCLEEAIKSANKLAGHPDTEYNIIPLPLYHPYPLSQSQKYKLGKL